MANEQIETLITQIMQGDESSAEKTFNQVFAQKMSDAIDNEKASVMANMMNKE